MGESTLYFHKDTLNRLQLSMWSKSKFRKGTLTYLHGGLVSAFCVTDFVVLLGKLCS